MTFIMSFLTNNGISMASDSKMTNLPSYSVDNNLDFRKTNYFNDYQFGVSIWGKLKFKRTWFWDWFYKTIKFFFKNHSNLEQLTKFLADELNNLKLTIKTGIHFTFYKEIDKVKYPVIYHITNDREDLTFQSQEDCVLLNSKPPFLLINGAYEPFSNAYSTLREYVLEVRDKFLDAKQKTPALLETGRTRNSKLLKECEYIISTLRQYQAIMEMTGVKRIIGEPINAICFNETGIIKEYSKIHFL